MHWSIIHLLKLSLLGTCSFATAFISSIYRHQCRYRLLWTSGVLDWFGVAKLISFCRDSTPITLPPHVCRRMSLRNILNPEKPPTLSLSAPANLSLSTITQENSSLAAANALIDHPLLDETPIAETSRSICSGSLSPAVQIAALSEEEIKAEIKAQIARWPPTYTARTDKKLQRRVRGLILDPWIVRGSIEPNRVTCYGCGERFSLDKRRDYYPGLWTKHREGCVGCKALKVGGYDKGLPVQWHILRVRKGGIALKKENKAIRDVLQKKAFNQKVPKDDSKVGQYVFKRKATLTLPKQRIEPNHHHGDRVDVAIDNRNQTLIPTHDGSSASFENLPTSIDRPLMFPSGSSVPTKWLRKSASKPQLHSMNELSWNASQFDTLFSIVFVFDHVLILYMIISLHSCDSAFEVRDSVSCVFRIYFKWSDQESITTFRVASSDTNGFDLNPLWIPFYTVDTIPSIRLYNSRVVWYARIY